LLQSRNSAIDSDVFSAFEKTRVKFETSGNSARNAFPANSGKAFAVAFPQLQ
jgi:hypothetical protein